MMIDIPDELVYDVATAMERLATVYRNDEHHDAEDVAKLQTCADQLDAIAARILDQRDTLAARVRDLEAQRDATGAALVSVTTERDTWKERAELALADLDRLRRPT